MQVECIRDNWHFDVETGKSGLTFKRGKRYDATDIDGEIIVRNEQGDLHTIKTKTGLSNFFNTYFKI